MASQFPVVVIIGPRQSGKTTLAKMVFPEKQFVSFDDLQMRSLALSNPRDFLNAFPGGLIIDEAQKVPAIFDTIKLLVDSEKYTPGKYILTGSSQLKLRENTSESLAGRAAYLRLLPFSISELKDENQKLNDPYSVIFNGQYPPLYDIEKKFKRDMWYENYIDTYLEMDVREHITASNLSTFRKFIQICATYNGKILSMDSIARDIGVSAPTIKSWLSVLESSFIIHLLEPDTDNLGKTLIKSPKLYFIDSGLLCYLLRLETKEELLLSTRKGAVVESFAISELLKARYNKGRRADLNYFRDRKGFEIDIIANWKHTFAIEIKSESNTEKKLSNNVRKYISLRGDDNTSGYVFYLGDYSMEIDGVKYLNMSDWDNIDK